MIKYIIAFKQSLDGTVRAAMISFASPETIPSRERILFPTQRLASCPPQSDRWKFEQFDRLSEAWAIRI
jgi:hypothetical protein